jgi:hypothetical protein
MLVGYPDPSDRIAGLPIIYPTIYPGVPRPFEGSVLRRSSKRRRAEHLEERAC